VPGVADSQAYDRYSYSRNNPVIFVDPSGHIPTCSLPDGEGGCFQSISQKITSNLGSRYGLSFRGSWTAQELAPIVQAMAEISNYVGGLNGGHGDEWVRKYIGGATFRHGTLEGDVIRPFESYAVGRIISPIGYGENSYVFPHNRVSLGWGYETSSDPVSHVRHELGHVVDNRMGGIFPAAVFGGGAADALMEYSSGMPASDFPAKYIFRFFGGAPVEDWPQNQGRISRYGNNSIADYFATTFDLTISNSSAVPSIARMWMNSFLSVTPWK